MTSLASMPIHIMPKPFADPDDKTAKKAADIASVVTKAIKRYLRGQSKRPNFEPVKESIDKIAGLGDELQAILDEFKAKEAEIAESDEFFDFDALEQDLRKKVRAAARKTASAAERMNSAGNTLSRIQCDLEDGYIVEMIAPDADKDMTARIARQILALMRKFGAANVNLSGAGDYRRGDTYALKLKVRIPPAVIYTDNKEHRLALSAADVTWNIGMGVNFNARYTKPTKSRDGRQHPHVMEGDGSICLGNADVETGGAMKEGRVFDLFETVHTLLQGAKETGAYSIKRWGNCESKCAISGQWRFRKDMQRIVYKGKEVLVDASLVLTCPITGNYIAKGGEETVEVDGVLYHKDAYMIVDGHEPILMNDPRIVKSTLSQSPVHPDAVGLCCLTGIQGRIIDDNYKKAQQPDDIVTLPDGRQVAVCNLDIVLLDDTTNFGSKGDLCRGWSKEKKDELQRIMGPVSDTRRDLWTHNSPAWHWTYERCMRIFQEKK